MADANAMLLKILDYYREHDMNVENVHQMRNAVPVQEVTYRYTGELTHASVLARQFVEALVEHGLTVHTAINSDGTMKAFMSQQDAAKWLEDYPGNGAHVTEISASQIFFR